MRRFLRFGLGWLAAFFLLGSLALAQDTMQNSQGTMNSGKAAGPKNMMTVSGCLKKGTEPSGFYITDTNGKTWELTSKSVDLSQHINHVVSVSGHEMKASKETESKNEQSEKSEASGGQYSDLYVKSLTMISDSCTR